MKSWKDLGANVLVATELTDASDEALRQGYERARRAGGGLVVCHVTPEVLGRHPLFPQQGGDDTAALVDLETRILDALSDRIAAITGQAADASGPVRVRVIVESGSPQAVLVRVAEDVGATLVVVGSGGVQGLGRFLLGSVSQHVVRHARVPVLVARPRPVAAHVLGATDFSASALPAIEASIEEARRMEGRLTLLHVIDVRPVEQTVEQARREAEEALRDALERSGVGQIVRADARVASGDAAEAIVREANDLDVDLVVVATRGRTGLRRVVLGSVAERVVSEAPCSVLVVRADAAHASD